MPKTPVAKRRPERRSYISYRPRKSKSVTFAVTVDAFDTPDVKQKIGQTMEDRGLRTIRSPLSGSRLVFLGDAAPLKDIKDRCDDRFCDATKDFQKQLDDQKRHFQNRLDDQKLHFQNRLDDQKRHFQNQLDD